VTNVIPNSEGQGRGPVQPLQAQRLTGVVLLSTVSFGRKTSTLGKHFTMKNHTNKHNGI
jgi:hypothetical protein